MRANERLAEALRVRQLNLLRHQISVRNAINAILNAMGGDIVGEIARSSPSEPGRVVYQQARVEKLIATVAGIVSTRYQQVRRMHLDEMAGLADTEALYLIDKVNELLGREAASLDLTKAQHRELARDALVSGAPMADWWAQQARSTQEKFAQLMRMGVLGEESDAELIDRVRGTKALGYEDGLLGVSRRMAKILVRGASSATIAAVRKKAVEDNPDVFRGIQQISVLDGRTSQTCISYAGKVWEVPGFKPVGHKLAYNGGVPRHPNCRSTEIPVILDELGGAPADDMDFDTFIAGKPAEVLDDLLGKGKADLYRAGKITLSDLVDQQGRPLTLEQLKATH